MINVYLYPVPAGVLNDPWLGDPTVPGTQPLDDRWFPELTHARPAPRRPQRPPTRPVVVAQSLYRDLVVRYGPVEGRRIYFEMEQQHSGPFGVGQKYDATKRRIQPGEARAAERAPVLEVPKAPAARRH